MSRVKQSTVVSPPRVNYMTFHEYRTIPIVSTKISSAEVSAFGETRPFGRYPRPGSGVGNGNGNTPGGVLVIPGGNHHGTPRGPQRVPPPRAGLPPLARLAFTGGATGGTTAEVPGGMWYHPLDGMTPRNHHGTTTRHPWWPACPARLPARRAGFPLPPRERVKIGECEAILFTTALCP